MSHTVCKLPAATATTQLPTATATTQLPTATATTQLPTATATTQLPTATSDHSRTLSELYIYIAHENVHSLYAPQCIGPPSLSVKHLVTACRRVTDWHTLGLQLDLTMDQLTNIQITNHMHGLDRLKAEMFNVWLKSSPSASWSDLITALRAMGEDSVASDIAATPSSGNELTITPH